MHVKQTLFQTSNISGINLHTLSTTKFKTTLIQINIALPLKRDDVTMGALLPFVLKRGTAHYPTELELRQKLDDLYGATLSVATFKKGENQILAFQLEIANAGIVKEEDVLIKEGMQLLFSLFTSPLVVEHGFKRNYVEIEVENLERKQKSLIDDKQRYANLRTTEIMCEGEPYGIRALGYREDLNKITPQHLYTFFERIMQSAPIDVYLVGEITPDIVEEQLRELEQKLNRQHTSTYAATVIKPEITPRTVTEQLDVTQGKLNIGFRTQTYLKDEDYVSLLLFNGIFGGFPHSKLFLNVRERASLAYYAFSQLESIKGILMVMAGIQFEHMEQAVSIIMDQLEEMRQGNMSDEELALTKTMLINQYRELTDSAYSMVDFHYTSLLGQRLREIDELITRIEQVKKDEIVGIAAKIQLDLTYFIRGRVQNA